MEETRGPCGEATQGPESERGPQDPPEEATVDLEVVSESTVDAEGESYSNLASETTRNRNDAAEGDILDLTSDDFDGISEVDFGVEFISNSCSDTADCTQVPEEITRVESSLAGEKSSGACVSSSVVHETSSKVPSNKADHRESSDELNHLSNWQRENLTRKQLSQLGATARADGLSYLTKNQFHKFMENQEPGAAYAEQLGSTGPLIHLSKRQRTKLWKKLREDAAAKHKLRNCKEAGLENEPGSRKPLQKDNINLANEKGGNTTAVNVSYSSTAIKVTCGVSGGDLPNLASNQSGRMSEVNSDVEIISHLCWGPPESLQVPNESTQIGVSPGELLSSYVVGRQLVGSFTARAKQIQSVNEQSNRGKQKPLPIKAALSLLSRNTEDWSHLSKNQRRKLKKKLVAAAQADNLGCMTKNQRRKWRRMQQAHKVAATHPGQVGSTDDLSHLSKNQRKKLRMQREHAAAVEKLRNSDPVLTSGLKNKSGSQKCPENVTTNLTNEGGSIATEGVSYARFTSEITGDVTEVQSTVEGDMSNLAGNHSRGISEADSDVEILFDLCHGSVESIRVPKVSTKMKVCPERKKKARECLSYRPVWETSSEVSADKARCDERTNDLSHLTKKQRQNSRGESKQVGAHPQNCDVVSAQMPESEAGLQETPGNTTVKQTIVKEKTAAAVGELHSSFAGRATKNPTEVTSTGGGDLANLNSNNLGGFSEGDSDVEIVFQSHQVTPECIEISDDASEIDVSPSAGKKSGEVPSSGVVGTHLTYRDKQMRSNNNLSHLPKKNKPNWKESEQNIKLKLRKEQAAARRAKKLQKGEVSLTKGQKRTLNNLLLSVGIIRGNLSAMQNIKLRPVKAAVAAGIVNRNSEVLQKFVAEVRGKVVKVKDSLRARTNGTKSVKAHTNEARLARTAKAVNLPQAKHLSAVEKRITKIQKGYQSWVPSSDPVINKTQREDAVRNEDTNKTQSEDAIKNNRPSENVTCMPSLTVGEPENAQCLTQLLDHQLTIQNLLRKDDTKFVVRVPVFNTQDEELEFIATHLKKTVGDSIFRGPDRVGLPPVIEPKFSQQSCDAEYNSTLPSSSGSRIIKSELRHMHDQQFTEQVPSPILKSRFRESNLPGSCDVRYTDLGRKQSNPSWSHEPQVMVNCSLQAQEPPIISRNPVETNNKVSIGTSPVRVREPCFRVTIPTYPYDSLHSERNAPEWLGTDGSRPVTLEHCGRSSSPHSSREGSFRSISSHRSLEDFRTSRSRSANRYWIHSHRSRSPLRLEQQFHRGRSPTSSRELLRCSSPQRSYDTHFSGRRAARSRNALVHIKLSQFNGGSRRPTK